MATNTVQYPDGRQEIINIPKAFSVGDVVAVTHRRDGGVVVQRVSSSRYQVCEYSVAAYGYGAETEFVELSENLGDLNSPRYTFETPLNYSQTNPGDSGFSIISGFTLVNNLSDLTRVVYRCGAYDFSDGLPCVSGHLSFFAFTDTGITYSYQHFFETFDVSGTSITVSLGTDFTDWIRAQEDIISVYVNIYTGCIVDKTQPEGLSEKTGEVFLTNQKLYYS